MPSTITNSTIRRRILWCICSFRWWTKWTQLPRNYSHRRLWMSTNLSRRCRRLRCCSPRICRILSCSISQWPRFCKFWMNMLKYFKDCKMKPFFLAGPSRKPTNWIFTIWRKILFTFNCWSSRTIWSKSKVVFKSYQETYWRKPLFTVPDGHSEGWRRINCQHSNRV